VSRPRALPGTAAAVAAVAWALAVTLGGCTGPASTASGDAWPSTPTPAPTGPVTVTILSGADTSQSAGTPPRQPGQPEPGMYSELVDWWNANEEPLTKIHVQLDTVAGGATAAHSEMLGDAQAGSTAYDVYNLDNEWVPEFAAGHYVRSLTGSGLPTGGFLGLPLASSQYQGQLYAAPFTTDAGLLYYRTDLVSKKQLTGLSSFPGLVSQAGQDMDKASAQGPAATIGYAGQFAGYEGLTVNLLELTHADDKDAFRADGTIRDSNAVTEALTQLQAALGGPIPQAELGSYDEAQGVAEFSVGQVVFMRNWPIYYSQLTAAKGKGASQASRDVGVTQLPFPSVLGGQDLAIAQASRHPSAALRVIEYLTSAQAERCLFAVAGFPATRDSAYANVPLPTGYDTVSGQPLCGNQVGPSVHIAAQIKAAVNGAFLRPRTPYYTEFSSLIQDQVPRLLEDPATMPSLVSSLAGELNAAATGHAPP
jgi:multiple sugar transport system substrate-binding protein